VSGILEERDNCRFILAIFPPQPPQPVDSRRDFFQLVRIGLQNLGVGTKLMHAIFGQDQRFAKRRQPHIEARVEPHAFFKCLNCRSQ